MPELMDLQIGLPATSVVLPLTKSQVTQNRDVSAIPRYVKDFCAQTDTIVISFPIKTVDLSA